MNSKAKFNLKTRIAAVTVLFVLLSLSCLRSIHIYQHHHFHSVFKQVADHPIKGDDSCAICDWAILLSTPENPLQCIIAKVFVQSPIVNTFIEIVDRLSFSSFSLRGPPHYL